MAVAADAYGKLPQAKQWALPNEGHIVAALDWAEPEAVRGRLRRLEVMEQSCNPRMQETHTE